MIPMTETIREKSTVRKDRDLTGLGLLAMALLLAASAWLLNKADATKPRNWNEDHLTYLPSGNMLKPMAMDLDEAAGDLLWVNAMIYFADAYLSNKSYRWLGHMLDVATLLNEHLYPAYEYGGVVLTREKTQLPDALRLLDRGVRVYPKDWRIRLYASLAQLALDSNYTKAAGYLEPVSLDKDVPNHIRTLCATLLNKGGGNRVALAFLVDRWVRTENTITREIFVDKIVELYPGPKEKSRERKDEVTRILNQIAREPSAELMGLGLIHEYLSESLSDRSKAMLEMLHR
jgi:hypothetical protein